MGIHRQGWLPQGKEQHTTGGLVPNTGQAHQVVFGFGNTIRLEEIKSDATSLLFDLIKYLLDPRSLDLGQPP
jgi:hypothetical protein